MLKLLCDNACGISRTNCLPFPSPATDKNNLKMLVQTMRSIFKMNQSKSVMRHGFPPPAATESDSSKEEALASIPVAVPDLPDVLTERPEVVASLRQHLLGFMAQGQAVSVSSVKTSRVAAHGAGGVGKVIFSPFYFWVSS